MYLSYNYKNVHLKKPGGLGDMDLESIAGEVGSMDRTLIMCLMLFHPYNHLVRRNIILMFINGKTRLKGIK